jgi:serine/threonine protein kinase
MGEVYRARDTRLPREVAIKVSSERFSDRFAREVQIVASLNHPNISTLYDVGPDYLVSRTTGSSARWGNRGTKLLYLGTNVQVTSIDIDTRAGFEAGPPIPLFSLMNSGGALTNPMWSVDDDRMRYLFITAPPTARTQPYTVVVNWESRIAK